jgi:hypothetical protein
LVLLLIPIFWGAAVTAERHLRFQHAYRTVYEKAAAVKNPPLKVHCRLYATPFESELHKVVFARSPDASWVLRPDGSFGRRKRAP